MSPKVQLNKIRTLGEIVDDSILFFKQNWKPLLKAYLVICGAFCITGLVLSTINQYNTFRAVADGENSITATYNLMYFVSILFDVVSQVMILLTSLCFIALYRDKGNMAPTVEEVWSYVRYYFFRILGNYFLMVLLILTGCLMCIIPGIYLWIPAALTLTIVIMENTTLGYSFSRAFKLIGDNWWYSFGALFLTTLLITVAGLLIVIPIMLIAGLIMFMTGGQFFSTFAIAVSIASHLGQFLYLIPHIAIALIYFSLSEKKEDITLLQRIELLGTNQDPEPEQPSAEEEY